MTQWDAPNQQTVRADESAPWDEGTGGDPGDVIGEQSTEPEGERLDAMTKAELLGEAEARGLEADAGMTKAEIRAVLETSEQAV